MSVDLSQVDVSGAKLPSTYNAAKRAISQCASLDECKDWSDKAAALASYAKQAQDDQLEQMAKRIRARATRRAGELLKQVDGRGSVWEAKRTGAVPLSREAVAAEVGMSRRQMKTATAIADVPEGDFEELVEAGATLTQIAQAGIQRPVAPLNRADAKALLYTLRTHAERLSALNIEEACAALDEPQRAQVRMLVARLDSYHDKIVTSL